MFHDDRRYIVRVVRLAPGGLLLIGLLWGGTVAALALMGPLRTSRETGVVISPNPRAMTSILQDGGDRRRTIRFHVSGTGRARNWRPEHVRQFDFMEEMRYESRFSRPKKDHLEERRRLEQLRFLLMSSSASAGTRPEWGITSILDQLGSADTLLKLGRNGMPVGPIEPESLSARERSRLLKYIRGPGSLDDKTERKIIRFISPYEEKTFSLRHQFRRNGFDTVMAKQTDAAGFERDVLLYAPVLPALFFYEFRNAERLRNSGQDSTPHSFLVSGSVLERYLQPFLRCRLQGTAQLRPGTEPDTYTGSGSFNMLRPDGSEQIGELHVRHIRLTGDSAAHQLRRATFRGRISVTAFSKQHLLRRIIFLDRPMFRITYTSDIPR